MNTKITEEAKNILKDSLKELESPKGSVLSGVQKLSRAANILTAEDVYIWCEIQLGNSEYTCPLEEYNNEIYDYVKDGGPVDIDGLNKILSKFIKKFNRLNLKNKIHYNTPEMNIKLDKDGGGYSNIGFIEERYNDLVKMKRGNDGTYYKTPLNRHINFVRKEAHNKATGLYKKIAFSDAPQTAFDVLKGEIDDKLLDLDPEMAENLMLAFKGVNTNNTEEWSQALTTCRRFIEKLANTLYPPTDEKINGRSLGKNQYINRLWAFMDRSIESESNKELAKSHVDFLGYYLESLHNITHKGVHASLTRYEAVKAVLHTYLIVGDILNYLDKSSKKDKKLNIHSASLDELESILGVKRGIAKEIIKLRVEQGTLNEKKLASIKGVGPKTISKAKELLSFEVTE